MPTLDEVKWAGDNITLPGAGTANKLEPTTALKDNGYDEDQIPTCQEENFWRNKVYEWIQELDGRTISGFQGAYPVGSVYMNATDATNPASLLGFGTWVSLGAGRVLIGSGTGTDINGVNGTFAAGDTGGEYEHILTIDEMPNHNHDVIGNDGDNNSGQARAPFMARDDVEGDVAPDNAVSYVGGSQAHNNIQPYYTVHMWRRTA